MTALLPASIMPAGRMFTAVEFDLPADVPPEMECFAHLRKSGAGRTGESAA